MAIKTSLASTPDYAALEKEAETYTPKGNGGAKSAVVDKPKVLNIMRYLSKTGTDVGGAFSVDTVNMYLTEKINDGYKLFSTHFIGDAPEGVGVLYILVLG